MLVMSLDYTLEK